MSQGQLLRHTTSGLLQHLEKTWSKRQRKAGFTSKQTSAILIILPLLLYAVHNIQHARYSNVCCGQQLLHSLFRRPQRAFLRSRRGRGTITTACPLAMATRPLSRSFVYIRPSYLTYLRHNVFSKQHADSR